ncbi:MAG: hypothetical protein ACK5QT_11270 [Oligoflexia bacterium]
MSVLVRRVWGVVAVSTSLYLSTSLVGASGSSFASEEPEFVVNERTGEVYKKVAPGTYRSNHSATTLEIRSFSSDIKPVTDPRLVDVAHQKHSEGQLLFSNNQSNTQAPQPRVTSEEEKRALKAALGDSTARSPGSYAQEARQQGLTQDDTLRNVGLQTVASPKATNPTASWTNEDRARLEEARRTVKIEEDAVNNPSIMRKTSNSYRSPAREDVAKLEAQRKQYNKENGYLENYDVVLRGTEAPSKPVFSTSQPVENQLPQAPQTAATSPSPQGAAPAPAQSQAAAAPPAASGQPDQALANAQARIAANNEKIQELERENNALTDRSDQGALANNIAKINALKADNKTIINNNPTLQAQSAFDVSKVTVSQEDTTAAEAAIKARQAERESQRVAGLANREQTKLDLSADGYKKLDSELSATSDDRCAYGASVDGKYSCGGTETLVKGAQVANQGSQMLGSIATQVMGANQTQKAARENSQAGFMESGAKMQITTGKMQVGLGAMNTLLGAIQYGYSSKHDGLATQVKSAAKGGVVVQDGIGDDQNLEKLKQNGQTANKTGYVTSNNQEAKAFIETYELNSKGRLDTMNMSVEDLNKYSAQDQGALKNQLIQRRQAAEIDKQNHVKSMLNKATRQAANEQTSISKEASAGAIVSVIAGAQQLIQGGFAIKAGKELKKAARELRQAQDTGSRFTMPDFGSPSQMPTQGGGTGTVITGNGTDPNQQPALEEPLAEETPPTLGDGFLPGGAPDSPITPPPAPQFAGPGNSQPINGQGQVGGGATGGAEPGADEEPKAEYAANLRDPGSQYVSGGGGYVGGGGGGASSGGGGPDLSGILDKLLGRMGEGATEFTDKPGMDEFGRAPASVMPPYSYLDRSVNIFERIHKAYQAKNRSGRVGI